MYLSPSGAGTRVHFIVLPATITHKLIGLIAELTNKMNLSEIRES